MGKIINGVDNEMTKPRLGRNNRVYFGFNPRRDAVDGLVVDYDFTLTPCDDVIYSDSKTPALENVNVPTDVIPGWRNHAVQMGGRYASHLLVSIFLADS